MPVVQASFIAREFVRERLLDSTIGFNGLIQQTATTYGVQDFQLSTQSTPPSLWLGRYDLPTLIRAGASWPAAVVSTVKVDSRGKLAMRVTPSTYSGPVLISVDFYMVYPSGNFPPDGEAYFSAVEDAMISTFDDAQTYGLLPSGLTYNNEIVVSQGKMEWTENTWIQQIACGLDFYLIV